jgi:hypothetical protein
LTWLVWVWRLAVGGGDGDGQGEHEYAVYIATVMVSDVPELGVGLTYEWDG